MSKVPCASPFSKIEATFGDEPGLVVRLVLESTESVRERPGSEVRVPESVKNAVLEKEMVVGRAAPVLGSFFADGAGELGVEEAVDEGLLLEGEEAGVSLL